MTDISSISAIEILDSRGYPTVEATVILKNGILGRASVPSGASTGSKEVLELRDKDTTRYQGKGVLTAVKNINTIIQPALLGKDVVDQRDIDNLLIHLDGTPNKSNLGANALLAVSLAIAKVAAISQKQTLYQYFAKLSGNTTMQLPVPMVNILNGGVHANNNLMIQELMILPIGASCFQEALRWAAEIFHTLGYFLKNKGYSTQVGDEGGFAPNLTSQSQAIEFVLHAIEQAGYQPGKQVFLALDCASSEFYNKGYYYFEDQKLDAMGWQTMLANWVKQYPILSIEDGMAENDIDGWIHLTHTLSSQVQLVGDDLFVTQTDLLKTGIQMKQANAILIKPNQVGTLSETLSAVQLAKTANYSTIISHRSGETEDSMIADLAVGTNAGQIKTGSTCRSDRIAKYNQLLRIEAESSQPICYNGFQTFQRFIN